ncbi:hypothetical protein CBR_g34653 [Chara braunii]|uniref:Uncharacterized protein n=1 Tax=Chara braunii TaxID=69332 RepID=A0A388JZ27_CHABU|nr:hypothetical protein CBR_g34653 [Chara braunii]|eukprot:GBG62953.1 hypothetical protein CBR_g34653 [Chara braunii]
MADLYRRLPVLLLVVILLVVVVVLFHMCINLKVPGRTRRRRSAKKGVDMHDWQPKSSALFDSPTAHHVQHSSARKSQQYDPSAYAHLPSHEIPLLLTDDEAEEVGSRTVTPGSGSTQDWAGSFSLEVGKRHPDNCTHNCSKKLRGDQEDVITRGVRQLHVGGSDADKEAAVEVDDFEDIDEEDEDDEEAAVDIWPQFKKVHMFMQESGKPDYFQLMGKERRSHGFNFVMERAVYEETKGSTLKNHTIHPRNVADTGAAGGVEMSSDSGGGRGDGGGVGDVRGEPHEEEDGSTRGSSFRTGSTVGLAKRKNMREQTFEALTDVMEQHDTLMATTLESVSKRQCSMLMRQCEIMESEVDAPPKKL